MIWSSTSICPTRRLFDDRLDDGPPSRAVIIATAAAVDGVRGARSGAILVQLHHRCRKRLRVASLNRQRRPHDDQDHRLQKKWNEGCRRDAVQGHLRARPEVQRELYQLLQDRRHLEWHVRRPRQADYYFVVDYGANAYAPVSVKSLTVYY